MAYTYQTFTSGQILTGAQAQQCEVNIRDHTHGLNSVQNIGLAWQVTSLAAAQGINLANNNFLHECAGSFDLNFYPATQLSSLFSATFVNVSTGRVVLKAAPSELIGPSSQFVLTPGASINVYSKGKSPLGLLGQTVGPFTLADFNFPSSVQQVRFDAIFPGDFDFYELFVTDPIMSAAGQVLAHPSVDSLSTAMSDGMANTTATASSAILLSDNVAVTSNQLLSTVIRFRNSATSGAAIFFQIDSQRRTSTGLNPVDATNNVAAASVAGIMNGIDIFAGPTATGYFMSGRGTLIGWRY